VTIVNSEFKLIDEKSLETSEALKYKNLQIQSQCFEILGP